MNVLDALRDLLDAKCALACRMNVLAYRMNVLDALYDLLDAKCALAYRMNVLAYRMNALALNSHHVDARNAQCALVCDALGARCDLRQTSRHESLALALDVRPFQRRALMRSDVDCPLVRLQSLSTSNQSPSGNELHEALSDQLSEPLYELLELHRDLSNALS